MRIVDAHVHLWDRTRHPLSWFRDDMGLAPSVTARDLEAAAAVNAAVAVQAADTLTEAVWLAAQAERSRMLPRIVLQYAAAPGEWAGATAPVMTSTVAGLRAAVPQFAADLADVPGLDDLGAGLARSDRVLEFLVRPEQLGGVAAFADRHPDLRIVVCHLGLGTGTVTDSWRSGLTDLARRPNAHAKLSGVIGSREKGELALIADAAVTAFGPERLMFGSDWPMSARRLAHADVIETTAQMLPALSAVEAAAIWHGTADRIYALGAS
ncbi:amidohydrolase family protein [Microbacterium sp. GXF0217]